MQMRKLSLTHASETNFVTLGGAPVCKVEEKELKGRERERDH